MGIRGSKPFRYGIRFKLAVFIGALVLALMVIDAGWNVYLQRQQSEKEAREKAEVIAGEMRAVWNYVDLNQNVVNRNPDGTFRTKTLVCVVAAKSVSTLFTASSDYTIRFVNQTPRQSAGTPDAFEERAFASFKTDSTEAYYEVETDAQGQSVFRYAEPLFVTETCLECHGEPVGELDQFGYPKEGMQLGDIGGALSITEPMDIYIQGMQLSVTQQVFMVFLMLALACICIYFAMSKLVLRPLAKLQTAAGKIGGGDFEHSIDISDVGDSDEISVFAHDFDKMAQRLKRLYADLESEVQLQTDELQELNEELVQQKEELRGALDLLNEETAYKSEFFAIMSHELRTPLTSVLAFARILQDVEVADEKVVHAIDEIESNATLLLNMVNNLLTLSKIDARRNELLVEPVDFVDLIGFIKNSLEPLAKNKGIAFTTRIDPDVPVTMADWEKLRRILENLVDNAIKYTHPKGRIRVSVAFEQGGMIVISVADDGIGIAEEDQKDIFERYRQGFQSPNRRYRGTGLGLSVVKELAEMHGGSVSVESARKQGSTFVVRIPYVRVDFEDPYEDTAD
ncbi:MAG: DUF3365 domain-containing protein [Coriobacteriales bacterium]|jgi:signal transduction histidine kinase|nr:DUF3365 domain-containing protein [Coriobacteriales bacterium]